MFSPFATPSFRRQHASKALTALAVLSVGLLVSACGKPAPKDTAPAPGQKQASRATPVRTEAAQLREAVRVHKLDAEVVSRASPVIAAEIAGRLDKVLVNEGQQVQAGQLLAELNATDVSLALQDTKAQAAQMTTMASEKARVLARNEELASQGFISSAQVAASKAEAQAALLQAQAYTARVALAERNASKTQLRAPFSGTVVKQHSPVGAFIRAGDPVVTLWSNANSYLTLKIPRTLVGVVQPGQTVEVTWAGQTHKTEVERVLPGIDALSQTATAQARLPDALLNVTGVALTAQLQEPLGQLLQVPTAAVQLAGESKHVFVVKDSKATRVAVTIGQESQGWTVVQSGLNEGERVVVDGASFVREGQTVQEAAVSAENAPAETTSSAVTPPAQK